jgi:acetamidase/formamidase
MSNASSPPEAASPEALPPPDASLAPGRDTLHGSFSRALAPAVTIASGDRIAVETVDVTWGVEQHGAPGTPRKRAPKGDGPRYDGPALCGPIYIEDARPGDVLAVSIERVVPASWGWSYAGDGPFNAALNRALDVDDALLVRWTLDREDGWAVSERGCRVPLRPFLGTIGCAPAADGWHSGWIPRATGGNLDCPLLTAGSTLYLPVAVPGGLLSLGDGHAAQGDGELGGSAIECPMETVVLRVAVRRGPSVEGLRAETPAGWVTLGVGDTLEAATHRAVRTMLDWLEAAFDVARTEALTLLSVAGSLRVTQLVNGRVGTHLVFDPDVLSGT